jgi:hypothetical protein
MKEQREKYENATMISLKDRIMEQDKLLASFKNNLTLIKREDQIKQNIIED